MSKALPGKGMHGWDSNNEVWVKISVDSNGNVQITSTDITSILTLLEDSTYGLSALETLVDGVESDLTAIKVKDTSPAFDSDTDSLQAISDAIASIPTTAMRGTDNAALATVLEDAMQKATSPSFSQDTDSLEGIREGLDTHDTDIKADIGDFSGQNNLQSLLAALGIPDVSAKSLYTCLITDRLDDSTFGLAQLQTEIAALESALPSDPADASDINAEFARITCHMDFWSDIVEEIQIGAGDEAGVIAMGNVVVADIPAGASITRVVAMFLCRSIENTNASVNAIDVAGGHIEVKEASGSYVTAIDIPDDAFGVAGSTREMGTVMIGDNDISGEVDANDTYTFELDDIGTDEDFLNFNDCQFGLRVYYII